MKVAFIGLGLMGSRMASHLHKNGVAVVGYNRTPREYTFPVAETVEAAVQDADVVFSMLSKPAAVEAQMFSLLDKMKPGAIWVDSSTVDPAFNEQSADRAQAAGVGYLAAPVAGSTPQAEQAALVFFVGGEVALLEKVKPLMQHMGQKVVPTGGVPTAAAIKLCINTMLAGSMALYAEVVAMGKSLGVADKLLFEMLPGTAVAAPFLQFKAKNLESGTYPVTFPLEHMHKDVKLSKEAATVDLALISLLEQQYAKAADSADARLDFSAIYKHIL